MRTKQIVGLFNILFLFELKKDNFFMNIKRKKSEINRWNSGT